MSATEFSIPSARGDVDLHCTEWAVEKPVAVLQITHGMTEYIGRYSGLAEYLNSKGIAVVGHDHLGHGGTCPDDLGYIADSDGDLLLVEDVRRVTETVSERYHGIPCFIMGHSMGSYVLRRYLTEYSDLVDGAVLMGTGNQPSSAIALITAIAKMLMKLKGVRYHSPFIDRMVLDNYSRGFETPALPNRWLSHDEDVLNAYNSDPLTSFTFTVSAYKDMFSLIGYDVKGIGIDSVRKDLPILFISGSEDPVGDYGKGVRKAAEMFRNHGLSPETLLYDGFRHELVNGKGCGRVYEDIGEWILGKVDRSLQSDTEGVQEMQGLGV
ncbi:MAG: lysophospholipase [archaeon]|nr:lysophospholipase [archaeon]